MKPKRRKLANATFSDGGPPSVKLGTRPRDTSTPQTGGAIGKGGGADQPDYFREEPRPNGGYPTQPDASVTPDRVTLSVRMRWNPIRGLTPERLVSYLDQWRLGFFRMAGMTWDAMERRDYMIKICKPKRDKDVARHGFDIMTVSDTDADANKDGKVDPAEEKLAEEQKDFLKRFWDNVTCQNALDPDEQGGLSLLLRQMMDAISKKYSVHEIVWQPKEDGTLTAKFIWCPVWWFEGTRGKLRFLPSEFQVYGNDMVPGQWLVTVGEGIMESISVLFLLRHRALHAWSAMLDKFGMPGLQAKTGAQKGSPEWNAAKSAIEDFAEEWAVVTSVNTELVLIEARAAMSVENGFTSFMEKMDKHIIQIFRGADLGTMSTKSATGASLQKDESEILETDDAKMCEETLTNRVSRYALQWKFGPDAPHLAYIKIRTAPKINVGPDLQVDDFLLRAGAPLGVKHTLERYNRQMPKKGEELLTPPVGPDPANPANPETPKTKSAANIANELPAAMFNDGPPDEPRDELGRWTDGRAGADRILSVSRTGSKGNQFQIHTVVRESGPRLVASIDGKPHAELAELNRHIPDAAKKVGFTGAVGNVLVRADEEPVIKTHMQEAALRWNRSELKAQWVEKISRQHAANVAREARGRVGRIGEDDQSIGKSADIQNTRDAVNAHALAAFARAIKLDMRPVVARLNAILAISDKPMFQEKLLAWLNDVESLKADIGADPEAARILQSAIAEAFGRGMAKA